MWSSWLRLAKDTDSWKPEALRGNWCPVFDESSGLRTEIVAGAIPEDFPAGCFVQNGPNPRWVRPNSGYHPFEGDGMLHSVEFVRGPVQRARYSNRWVRTAKWYAEDAAQGPLTSGFMDGDLLRLGMNFVLNTAHFFIALPFILTDGRSATAGAGTANTNVVHHAGKTLVLQEPQRPIVVNMPQLTTDGPLRTVKAGFTAHPKVCPVTGELIWFSYLGGAGLSYGVWDRDGCPVHETHIPLRHSVMVHDIAVTRHHTVVLDCPLLMTPDPARGEGPLHLDKEEPMRLGVLPRHGSGEEVEWYEVPGPGKMCFHAMNAYEDEDSGEIVVIGCAQPDISIWDMNVAHAHETKLTEWRIDQSTRRVAERTLCDVPSDFPRVNEQRLGLPFRYGYSAAFDPANRGAVVPKFKGVVKQDVRSAETRMWKGSDRVFNGEPIYVPRVGADPADEDDGYVLVWAHDEGRRVSEVLILDAKDFGKAPLCRIQLPRRVPYGFHVAWVPAQD